MSEFLEDMKDMIIGILIFTAVAAASVGLLRLCFLLFDWLLEAG